MAEQLAFQQFGTQGRAGDGGKRLVGPAAPAVHGAGEHGLACAAWPAQEHHRLRSRRLPRQGKCPLHPRMLGAERGLRMQAGQVLLQAGDALLHAAQGSGPLRDEPHLVGREGLGKVVGSPAPHRLYSGVNGGVGGDDHQLEPGRDAEQGRDEVKAALHAETQINKGHVKDLSACLSLRVLAAADRSHPMATALQAKGQHLADVGLVIDDEDVHGPEW
jgi:hypothetical protein